MKKTFLKVSIIIPSFNRAAIIEETLQSVQSQSYQNWECIVVDDGSTDDSIKVVESFCRKDARFSSHTNQRMKGAPGSRNVGIAKSKGDYLIFLDSDDLLEQNCLANRVMEFEKNSDCDFLVFSTVEFKNKLDDTNLLFNVNTTENIICRFLNLDVPWITMAAIWKRESLINVGQWNENLLSWQDWDLHLRALLKGYKYKYFSKVDNFLRRDNEAESIGRNSISKSHLQSHLNLFEELKPLLKDNAEYLYRINGLTYWVAEQALSQGFVHLAKKAVNISHENLNIFKRLINLGGLTFFQKMYVRYPQMPDFGTTRKVYYQAKY
jgi:glycosyltransferase involved in cell wall biosynthesis